MKLIDRISAHRLLTTLLNFILSLVKLLVPNKTEEKKPWTPRWRRNKNEQ